VEVQVLSGGPFFISMIFDEKTLIWKRTANHNN
jgi:hypothetical protein